ncbi:proline dehydrogenase family protein [Ornithinimicrobium cavernae]|uniref:proline dehydrogenase family protein n=1 Tax=Ornithinimicrobium cavernae TaxID=2666047 RepID=UPI001F455251|nr:proline dehydrogenase family protein [Ornithinimicrobium cavernae]
MNLLRRPILALSALPGVRRALSGMPVTRRVVERFVAGERTTDAVAAVSALRERGLLATVDFLGEYTQEEAVARATAEEYLTLLGALEEAGVAQGTEVSVKLSALGLFLGGTDRSYGMQRVTEHVRGIAKKAESLGARMTIDMEDHTTVDSTLTVLHALREEFPDTGVAIQSMLLRTPGDLGRLADTGSRVRLVKGAYDEPPTVAHRTRPAITAAYLRDLRLLMHGRGYPMVASHDPEVITAALALAEETRRAPGSFEFQFLSGIRTDEQGRLRDLGHTVRVYVPYGTDWYGYFTRRLAEKPDNLRFFLRALVQRA